MGTLRIAALMACSLLLVAGGPTRPFTVLFCPDCWHFCDLEEGLDHDGSCERCSKLPVHLQAEEIQWHWCYENGAWDQMACEEECESGCCTTRASLFLTVNRDQEDLYEMDYCPECRLFRSVMPARGRRGFCQGCDKPAIRAIAVVRTWYGCAFESTWSEEVCPRDRTRGCCEAYTGCLPARLVIEQGDPSRTGGAVPMLVSTQWLENHLGMEDLVVLHVGFGAEAPGAHERAVYSQAHIPEARRVRWDELVVPRGDLANEIPDVPALESLVRSLGIDEKSRIVLYDTGAGLEASRAYVTLDYLGLGPRTSILDGHWKKWRSEGRASTSVEPEVEPSEFVARPRSDVLIGLAALRLALAWSDEVLPAVTLLDARAPGEYSGWRSSTGVLRPGHIPGATNLYWSRCAEDRDTAALRSRDELADLFRAAGASLHSTLVVYCRTGIQASHLYVTAKHLGYRVRLYDGSFSEWSSQPELPVEIGSDARSKVSGE